MFVTGPISVNLSLFLFKKELKKLASSLLKDGLAIALFIMGATFWFNTLANKMHLLIVYTIVQKDFCKKI
jgi:hypothetical protein